MNLVWVYLRLYADCAASAARAIAQSPWTVVLPLVALAAYTAAFPLAAQLGPGAGIAMAFVQAALLSGYFYFVREGIAGSRVGVGEIGKSLGAYLWSFVNVAFVLWVVGLVLSRMLQGPSATAATLLLQLLIFVLLNAVPEAITQQGTTGGIATIQASVEFIQANWLEWLLPNALVGALLFFGVPWLQAGLAGLFGGLGGGALPLLLLGAVISAALHFAALFRGFLFKELAASGHRQRMFKYRNR